MIDLDQSQVFGPLYFQFPFYQVSSSHYIYFCHINRALQCTFINNDSKAPFPPPCYSNRVPGNRKPRNGSRRNRDRRRDIDRGYRAKIAIATRQPAVTRKAAVLCSSVRWERSQYDDKNALVMLRKIDTSGIQYSI